MRKDKNNKKEQENNIGKIIYAFLLFMPIIAIGFTCLYAVSNKNAYKSYYGEDINKYNLSEVDNLNQFIEGYTYKFSSTGITQEISNNNNQRIYFTNMKDFSTSQINVPSLDSADSFCFTYYTSNYIVIYEGNTQLTAINITNYSTNFTFEYVSNTYNRDTFNDYYIDNTIYRFDYVETSFVSEVFYYSIDRVCESSLFNWAENSIIYTTTSATCNALSITTPFIPLLMSYWLIISVIYILYDIVLILVWALHDKIHSLKDNIV